jgi:hypothetical protein
MKRSSLFLFFLLLSFPLWAAPPKDFRIVYFSSAGSMEKSTVEKITVQEGSATMDRDAVQVGGGEKEKFTKTYKVSSEQLENLYQLVLTSGVMTWPVSSETSHQSRVEEYFEITAEGKTVKRTRWEGGNLESFRKFYEDFNRWYTDIRSVRF